MRIINYVALTIFIWILGVAPGIAQTPENFDNSTTVTYTTKDVLSLMTKEKKIISKT